MVNRMNLVVKKYFEEIVKKYFEDVVKKYFEEVKSFGGSLVGRDRCGVGGAVRISTTLAAAGRQLIVVPDKSNFEWTVVNIRMGKEHLIHNSCFETFQ